MENVIGVINLVNQKPFLKELTQHRGLSSVPFAGRYRLIDFTLSNFVHANINKVAIFTKEKYRSLMDHIGSGKEWDLDRSIGGLFLLPPVHPDEKLHGDLQQFYDHLELFRRSSEDTVVISPGYHVGKVDYQEIIEKHRQSNADITVVYKDYVGKPVEKLVYHTCQLDDEENVTDIGLYTSPKEGDHVCLESFVINKDLLIDLILKCRANDEYDFLKDALKGNLHNLKVKGFHFKGKLPFIHSVESYYDSNMEFLNPEQLREFFNDKWNVYTKKKHGAPTKYSATSNVSNSIIANGCDIKGIVENSIIFRGVKIGKGAVVKNSIIMQMGEIEEGAYVENMITDKQVKITRDKTIIGHGQPEVIRKAETI